VPSGFAGSPTVYRMRLMHCTVQHVSSTLYTLPSVYPVPLTHRQRIFNTLYSLTAYIQNPFHTAQRVSNTIYASPTVYPMPFTHCPACIQNHLHTTQCVSNTLYTLPNVYPTPFMHRPSCIQRPLRIFTLPSL
jgi:hypothetical protein